MCMAASLSSQPLSSVRRRQALRPQQCHCGVKGKIRAKYHIYKTAPPYLDRLGIRDLPHNETRRAGVLTYFCGV